MTRTETLPRTLLYLSLFGLVFFGFNIFIHSFHFVLIYDIKRLFSASLVIVSCLLIIFSKSVRDGVSSLIVQLPGSTKALLILFLFSVAIADFNSRLPWVLDKEFFYLFGLFVSTATIATIVINQKTRLLGVFSFVIVLLFMSVLLGHSLALERGEVPDYKDIISFLNPRYINHIQTLITIPCLYLSMVAKPLKSRMWYSLVTILNVALLFALDSRGSGLAILTAITIWAIADRRLRKLIVHRTLLFVFLGFAVKFAVFSPLPAYLTFGEFPDTLLELRTGSSSRIDIWLDAIQMASFWGHGGQAYVCNSHPEVYSPHNTLILLAFDWGVISALAFSVLAMFCLSTVFSTKHRLLRVLGVSVLCGLGHSLIAGLFIPPLSQITTVLLLALFWAVYRRSNPVPQHSENRYGTWITILLILFSACSIFVTSDRIYNRVANNFYMDIPPSLDYYRPNFWLENNCPETKPYLRTGHRQTPD